MTDSVIPNGNAAPVHINFTDFVNAIKKDKLPKPLEVSTKTPLPNKTNNSSRNSKRPCRNKEAKGRVYNFNLKSKNDVAVEFPKNLTENNSKGVAVAENAFDRLNGLNNEPDGYNATSSIVKACYLKQFLP